MKIEDFSISDYEAAYSFWKKIDGMGLSSADDRENIDRFIKQNQGLSLVCKNGNKIVGTLLCGQDGRRGYLYHLAVDPLYRRRGIGTLLVEKCLERLRGCGIGKCHLFVYASNRTGQEYWEKTGWHLRRDILVFSKDL
ncbi:MAG: GNAT family N-acetyltransferase [Spirochaetota bacterium]